MNTLAYSPRLEKLFIELREEMLAKEKKPQAEAAALVLSLPCFKPIESMLNQSTNATNSALITDDDDENASTPKKKAAAAKPVHNHHHLSIQEASMSESVPILKPLSSSDNKPTPTAAAPVVAELASSTNVLTSFVFSPIVGKNSFINQNLPTKSFSASKAETSELKQPVRSSPRTSQASKRKLDLNSLIDQMPDQEFIAIKMADGSGGGGERKPSEKRKYSELRSSSSSSQNRRSAAASASPLTEHQKEVRKQRSFIPLEVQSVLTHTNDSQMSFSHLEEDTTTQSSNFPTSYSSNGLK